MPKVANAVPAIAPSVAITAASVSSWRAMAPRLAPTARRIESSRRRATARSSAMIATFTQAMSSTEPAAASRTARRSCRCPYWRVRSDSAPSDHLPAG